MRFPETFGELTSDWYQVGHSGKDHSFKLIRPDKTASFDPIKPQEGTLHIIKGASYLCANQLKLAQSSIPVFKIVAVKGFLNMKKDQLLKLALDVYEKECQYLKELAIDTDQKKSMGTFSVPTTCYAVKGRKYHLNAAEVIITYEQIMYATLSYFFVNGLYDLKTIPIDYFFPTIVDEKP